MAKNSYFSSKLGAKGEWFALKTILIYFINGSDISKDFSMNFDKFIPLAGPLDLHFGPQKAQKSVKLSIMAAEGPWFALKPILIDFVSGSDISYDFSMNSDKFSPSLDLKTFIFGPKLAKYQYLS